MAQIYSSLLFIGFFLFSALLSAQNVGIGVPSPSEKLEVAGNVYAQRLLVKSNTVTSTSDLSFTANAHIETDNSMTFSIDANNAGAIEYFGFGMNSASRNGSFSELMRIEEGGNVGIGTISPSAKLEIVGNLLLQNGTAVNEFSTDGTLAGNNDNTIPTEKAVKTYVDAQVGDNDDWDKSSDDIFNNNAGNVGIGNSSPLGKLHVTGNVIIRDDNAQQLELRRSDDYGGLAYAMVEPRTPIPSVKKASEISYTGTSALYPNILGESDAQGACLTGLTYAQAVAEAESRGSRLPTIEEIEAEIAGGTGCGFDNEIIWSQTKAGNGKRWVNYGKPSNFTNGGRQALDETATAAVRFVAEEDKGNLPAITDSEGALRTDKVKARVGNGIQFVDENDNIGIFLEDGGFVGIGGVTNPTEKLEISGNAYLSDATGMLMLKGANGDDYELRPGQNNLYGVAVRATVNPANEGSIFSVESAGSATRFGVTQGNGAFARDGFYVGLFDDGNLVQASAEAYMNINGDGYLSNSLGIGTTSVGSYALYVNGRIRSNGINETSDRRFKKDIQPLENAMDIVRLLNGVSYYWRADEFPERKFDTQQDLGVIAQDIEKVLPQVVETDADGYKSVQYSHIVPLLIEALKEQEKDFNFKLAEKDAELTTLKAQVEKIENYLEQNSYSNNGYSVKK